MVTSEAGKKILADYESYKSEHRTEGDWARVQEGADRQKATALYNAERQLRLAERAGADANTIRSYEANIKKIQLQSDWGGSGTATPVIQKNTAYENALARSADSNLSGYERAMARDMAGLPNTSDPNVYYDQKSKTLRSTGGSAGYKRGTFAGSSTTPQYALSSDPAMPSGEAAERRETWEKFFYDPNSLAYKPQSFVEAEQKIGEATTKRLKFENMADQLGIDLDKEYKQHEYIQQISDVNPMVNPNAPTATQDPVAMAQQNLFAVKKQQDLDRLQARIIGINEAITAEKARIEGMGHVASEANMNKYSTKYRGLVDLKERLQGEASAVKMELKQSEVQLDSGADIVSQAGVAFSGIGSGNPMEKVQTFTPVTSGYTDPTARDGTEGTIMDSNFTLDSLTSMIPSVPQAFGVTEVKPKKSEKSMYDQIMENSQDARMVDVNIRDTDGSIALVNNMADQLGLPTSSTKEKAGQFLTSSGWVTIKGLDPKSEKGKALQKQYAKQAQTRVDNIAQTEYFTALTGGKVPLSKALWEPETTQAYKIDGKLQDTLPQETIDLTKTFLAERGLSADTPMGELRLTPTKYEVARTQAQMAGADPMGLLPDTPDTPYTRAGDFSGYVDPATRVQEITDEAWKPRGLPTMADFEVGGDAKPEDWTIERTSGTPYFSADFDPVGYVASGGVYPKGWLSQLKEAGFGDVPTLTGGSFNLLPRAFADDGTPIYSPPTWQENFAEEAGKIGQDLWSSLTFADRVDTGKLDPNFFTDRITAEGDTELKGADLVRSTPTFADDLNYYMSTAMRPIYNLGKEGYNLTQPEENQVDVNYTASGNFFGAWIGAGEFAFTGGKSGKPLEEGMADTWDYVQKDPLRFASELPAEALLWWTGGKAFNLATKLSPLKYGASRLQEAVQIGTKVPDKFKSTPLKTTDNLLAGSEKTSAMTGKVANDLEYLAINNRAGIALTQNEKIGLQTILGRIKGVDKMSAEQLGISEKNLKAIKLAFDKKPNSTTATNIEKNLQSFMKDDDNMKMLSKAINKATKEARKSDFDVKTTNLWRGFYLQGRKGNVKLLAGSSGGGRLGWGGQFYRGNRPDILFGGQSGRAIDEALTGMKGSRAKTWIAGLGEGPEKTLFYGEKTRKFLGETSPTVTGAPGKPRMDPLSLLKMEQWIKAREMINPAKYSKKQFGAFMQETFKDLSTKESRKILKVTSDLQKKGLIETVHGSPATQYGMSRPVQLQAGKVLQAGDIDIVVTNPKHLNKVAKAYKKELGDTFGIDRLVLDTSGKNKLIYLASSEVKDLAKNKATVEGYLTNSQARLLKLQTALKKAKDPQRRNELGLRISDEKNSIKNFKQRIKADEAEIKSLTSDKSTMRKLVEVMDDQPDVTENALIAKGSKFLGEGYGINRTIKVPTWTDAKSMIGVRGKEYQTATNLSTVLGFQKNQRGFSGWSMGPVAGREKDILRSYWQVKDYGLREGGKKGQEIVEQAETIRKLYPQLEKQFDQPLALEQVFQMSTMTKGVPKEYVGTMLKGAWAGGITPAQNIVTTKYSPGAVGWVYPDDPLMKIQLTSDKRIWDNISTELKGKGSVKSLEDEVADVISHEHMHTTLQKIGLTETQGNARAIEKFADQMSSEWDVLAYSGKGNPPIQIKYAQDKMLTPEQRAKLESVVFQSQLPRMKQWFGSDLATGGFVDLSTQMLGRNIPEPPPSIIQQTQTGQTKPIWQIFQEQELAEAEKAFGAVDELIDGITGAKTIDDVWSAWTQRGSSVTQESVPVSPPPVPVQLQQPKSKKLSDDMSDSEVISYFRNVGSQKFEIEGVSGFNFKTWNQVIDTFEGRAETPSEMARMLKNMRQQMQENPFKPSAVRDFGTTPSVKPASVKPSVKSGGKPSVSSRPSFAPSSVIPSSVPSSYAPSSIPSLRPSSKASSRPSSKVSSRPSSLVPSKVPSRLSNISKPIASPFSPYVDMSADRKKRKKQKKKSGKKKSAVWAVGKSVWDAQGYLFESGMEYKVGRRGSKGFR